VRHCVHAVEPAHRRQLRAAPGGSSALTSYRFDLRTPAEASFVPGSTYVAHGQLSSFSVAVSPDGTMAYTPNAESATISAFRVGETGEIALVGDGVAGRTGEGSRPMDLTFDASGKHLYVLTPGTRNIVGFDVAQDGSLTARPLEEVNVPETAVGLVGF